MGDRRRPATLLIAALLLAGAADAQTRTGTTGRWEVEAHGGFTLGVVPTGGAIGVPEPGAPIATSNPIFPSREVPSWFVGDGAELLNAVNEDFGLANRIQPLETALQSLGIDRRGSATGGVRVRRFLTPVHSVEFSVDVMTGTGRVTDDFLAAVDETRASFETAIRALLSTGPLSAPTVVASMLTSGGASRQVAFSGALVQHLRQGGSITPYVTAGGGMTRGSGTAPSVTLNGSYQFDILGLVPIEEFDSVELRVDHRTTFVGVVGAGLRRDVSDRWGLRVDGRVFIGPNPIRARLTARPSTTPGAPSGFIESFTSPSVQFSNDPGTGRRSTLGGPGIDDYEIFLGDGLQTRVLVTVGVFVRF